MLQWENYKKKSKTKPGSAAAVLSSGCFGTSVWSFKKATAPLLWLYQCPLSRKHNQNAQCYLFVNLHASRPILEDFKLL